METIYTIVGILENIGEPTLVHLIGSYHSLESARNGLETHIKDTFKSIIPEDELEIFIEDGYTSKNKWGYADYDNDIVSIFEIIQCELKD